MRFLCVSDQKKSLDPEIQYNWDVTNDALFKVFVRDVSIQREDGKIESV